MLNFILSLEKYSSETKEVVEVKIIFLHNLIVAPLLRITTDTVFEQNPSELKKLYQNY